MCHMSRVNCHMSKWWRVCYQWGLPHLVCLDIMMRHYDETLRWDIMMSHIDGCWRTLMTINKLWWHLMTFDNLLWSVMTFDDLWYGDDAIGMALWQFWLSLIILIISMNEFGIDCFALLCLKPVVRFNKWKLWMFRKCFIELMFVQHRVLYRARYEMIYQILNRWLRCHTEDF